MPALMVEFVDVAPVTPHQHDQENCVVQVTDFLVPLMKEEIVKVLQPLPQERIHERVADLLECFEPLIKDEIVEMLHLLPQV